MDLVPRLEDPGDVHEQLVPAVRRASLFGTADCDEFFRVLMPQELRSQARNSAQVMVITSSSGCSSQIEYGRYVLR